MLYLSSLALAAALLQGQEITTFIESQMKVEHIPGVAIGIVQHDQIVYTHGFGSGITPQSDFLIGSTSKSITALAIMQLVDAGKIRLDVPVRQYLPWFELQDKEASKKITIRHLLNHMSGLPYLNTLDGTENFQQGLKSIRLAYPVGTAYEYSDLGYEVLGFLLEAVTHQTYAAYVKVHVLEPLDMRSTYLTYDEATAHGLVDGYQYFFGLLRAKPTDRYKDHDVGDGAIVSTAEDMCHLLIAELNDGVYQGHKVLEPASLALMKEPRGDVGSVYGMGWFIEQWNGLKSINHMGMNPNFSTMVNVLPEQGYGIVILMNVNSFSIMGQTNLMDGVIRRLHGQEKIAYLPEELMQRWLLLALLTAGSGQVAYALWKWRSAGFKISPQATPQTILKLAVGVAMVLIYLVIIPYYAASPIAELMSLQPDIGYGLIAGAVLTVIGVFLGVVNN